MIKNKILVLTILSLICIGGCSTNKNTMKKTIPVDVNTLRVDYVEESMYIMIRRKWGGSGDADVIEKLNDLAEKKFPDGKYIAHSGVKKRDIDGYRFIDKIHFTGESFLYYVYREIKDEGGI